MQRGPQEKDGAETVGLTSFGLWAARGDMAALTGAVPVPALPGLPARCETFLGWGARPSARRAGALARQAGKPLLLVEDGFLKGYDPGLREPPHSYVLDRTGIYFDTARPSDFAAHVDGPPPSAAQSEWALAAMARMRAERITKFNNWPQGQAGAESPAGGRPYLLLVDQVAHDASIAGAGAGPASFERLVREAADEAAGRALVVRTHPAARKGSALMEAARRLGVPVLVPGPVNPWCLVEEADAVYTISSQIGFEALMAGRPVISYGRSFYAGRGLTRDRFEHPALKPASLAQLFVAFHAHYAVYLDLHTRRRVSLDVALDQALAVRDQRARLRGRVHTAGLSPWKRRAVAPFLVGPKGRPRHALAHPAALRRARAEGGEVAVWGPESAEGPFLRLEDGFLRSAGLGVDLVMPSSLTLDRAGVHYERDRPGELETLLSLTDFTPRILSRARRLREAIVAGGVTKYNVGQGFEPPAVAEGRLRILVPGQVEADRSIRLGSPSVSTNAALVAACRALFPQAFIVFRPHPDVASGRRPGGAAPRGQDVTAPGGSVHQWIAWADRVETMTSLTGFEALLRGRAVGVHGTPFYAGWGLTDDRLEAPRRTRALSLDELVAGALILYPFHVHPLSRLPCTPEELVRALAAEAAGSGRVPGWRERLEQAVNRAAVLWRDRLR
ncbi:capsular polysaccharide biosynthesis protein [Aureimonas populi]|uniref:Capsular polysaccharide biosynthesis protein n=1 Tax=Aureimonas populi TaxID=1701758 RepID=A0ABW5CMU6_9HYPH|nr:capsular polysaccharide biosynthesis protein [Aureimonas populi]